MPLDAQEYFNDPVLKVLIDADALLSDESKWCKHDLYFDGAVCLLGALGMTKDWDFCEASEAAIEMVANILPPDGFAGMNKVWQFNDHQATTFADIKALFAKAIAARQEELAHV